MRSKASQIGNLGDDTLMRYKLIVDQYFINNFRKGDAVKAVLGETNEQGKKRTAAAATTLFNRMEKFKEVQDYIEEKRQRTMKRNEVDIDELIAELTAMIRVDILEMFNSDGTVKELDKMTPNARKCIQSIEIERKQSRDGRKNPLSYCKLNLYSKLEAMEKLMKHFGAYEEDNRQKGNKVLHRPVINIGGKDANKVRQQIIMDIKESVKHD